MDRSVSDKILRALKKHYGDVSPELNFNSLYQITVAVVLSAQTTDRQVNSVTPVLFKKYPDFSDLARAKIPDIEKIIHSTGFYHAKARNIHSLAQQVVKRFGGKLPSAREDLESLPGIGRKSAGVILSQGFGIPAIAVDTHVGRIARRLGYSVSENPTVVERDLTAMIPSEMWTESHLLLINHGRKICNARKPLCGQCPVISLCSFENKCV